MRVVLEARRMILEAIRVVLEARRMLLEAVRVVKRPGECF